jgi:hypothetical protein
VRSVPRVATVVAAVATLSVFGLLPAAQAGSIPSDCTLTTIDTRTKSLSCHSRPATQKWRLLVYCMGWGVQDEAYGNIVTGNGTSTARCTVGTADFPNFVVV